MAAIDKVYATHDEAKEFILWVESGIDNKFKEEFKDAGNVSLKDFMYVKSIGDIEEHSSTFPMAMFPSLVEKWLYRQPGLPAFAKNELKTNYGLNDDSEEAEFMSSSIEIEDTREMGSHAKILSRTGAMLGRDNYKLPCIEVWNAYYMNNWLDKHYGNEDHLSRFKHYKEYYEKAPKELVALDKDIYWFCGETKDWENHLFQKKKNIIGWKSSCEHLRNGKSLKAIIRHITKKHKFPIGTIIMVSDWRYVGEMLIKITK